MKLRKIIITVLAAAIMSSLTACGGTTGTDDATEAVTTAEATEAAEETETTEAADEESADADTSQTEEADSAEEDEASESEDSDTPAGDGLVSEENLQKGWAWMRNKGFSLYSMTYEDLVDYFGVDGELTKDEYDETTKRNKRDYKYISEDDATHYILINLEEKDAEGAPGVYNITTISANGFDGPEAEEKYKDE